jgi:hypothetical protein
MYILHIPLTTTPHHTHTHPWRISADIASVERSQRHVRHFAFHRLALRSAPPLAPVLPPPRPQCEIYEKEQPSPLRHPASCVIGSNVCRSRAGPKPRFVDLTGIRKRAEQLPSSLSLAYNRLQRIQESTKQIEDRWSNHSSHTRHTHTARTHARTHTRPTTRHSLTNMSCI